MRYAVTTGNIIWSIHNRRANAIKRMIKVRRLFDYVFTVRGLRPKGEIPGWEPGDNPSERHWVDVGSEPQHTEAGGR